MANRFSALTARESIRFLWITAGRSSCSVSSALVTLQIEQSTTQRPCATDMFTFNSSSPPSLAVNLRLQVAFTSPYALTPDLNLSNCSHRVSGPPRYSVPQALSCWLNLSSLNPSRRAYDKPPCIRDAYSHGPSSLSSLRGAALPWSWLSQPRPLLHSSEPKPG